MTPDQFATALRTYCQGTGASVTSWGRTAKHNRQVGGQPGSLHLVWLAADVVYDAPVDLARRRVVATRLGLFVWPESDHDHIRTAERATA